MTVDDRGVVAESISVGESRARRQRRRRRLHPGDGLGREQPHTVQGAPVDHHAQIPGHLARRRVQRSRRSDDDVIVVGLGDPIRLVALRQQGRVTRHVEGRALYAERVEHVRADIVLEDRPGDSLDGVGRDRRAGVAVGHVGARRPAADPRAGVVGKPFSQGHLGIVHLRVLTEVDVVEAGRVLHDRGQGDRMRLFPAVGESDLWHQLSDRHVESKESGFDGVEHRQGREALGDGPHAEQVVGCHVDASSNVRLADTTGPDRPVLVHQRDRGPGNPVLVEDLLELRRQFLDVDYPST